MFFSFDAKWPVLLNFVFIQVMTYIIMLTSQTNWLLQIFSIVFNSWKKTLFGSKAKISLKPLYVWWKKVLGKQRRLWAFDPKDRFQLSAQEWRGMEEEETEVTALCSHSNERERRSDDCQCIGDRNGDIQKDRLKQSLSMESWLSWKFTL